MESPSANNGKVTPTMQQHTTTIVLSSHKTHIASPTLGQSPSPKPKSRKKKEKEEGKDKKKKRDHEGHHHSSKSRGVLVRLPKELLRVVCEYLTFEEMFTCARVCKKLSRRMYRMLTNTKQCTPVEKADLKLLSDPSAFEDGMTFYRMADPQTTPTTNAALQYTNPAAADGKLSMSVLRTTAKKGNLRHTKSSGGVSNSVHHLEAGQVAYHLKQLEHMVLYSTVNGNEIVRVANNWILFNRSVFMKISDQLNAANHDEKEEEKYLIDMILVEANLIRKVKTSFLGRPGTAFVEPFCEISLDQLHLRTSVASHEADPVWNEDCSFILGSKTTNNLQIAMYDYGKLGRHNKLGTVEISLKNLACDVLHDVWHPVQAQDNEISGKFHVLVQKTLIPKNKEVDTRNIGILGYCGPICESVPMRLEAGDIVLISNSEFYTHIAKLGTMSVWDHIAMVVEVEKELHLFESSPDGVFTTPLNRRLKFYLKGSTLGVRRLIMSRTPEMKKALETFIKEVDGRPYKKNWMDLVRAWQGSHTSEDLSSIFCSELVAAAYKRMGLLSNDIPSNNFLPVDFALPNNAKVKLIQGKLDKIRMIYQQASST